MPHLTSHFRSGEHLREMRCVCGISHFSFLIKTNNPKGRGERQSEHTAADGVAGQRALHAAGARAGGAGASQRVKSYCNDPRGPETAACSEAFGACARCCNRCPFYLHVGCSNSGP